MKSSLGPLLNRFACVALLIRFALLALAALLTLLAFLVPSASAHDAWLESEKSGEDATRLALTLRVGETFQRGENRALDRVRIARFEAETPAGKLDLLPAVKDGEKPFASVPAADFARGALVTLARKQVLISLKPEQFLTYARHEGFDAALAERARRNESAQPAHEAYSRFLREWVAPPAASPEATALITRPSGLPIEVVPEVDPAFVLAGGSLPVRVLFEGKPLGAAKLSLLRRTEGKVESQVARTDADGRATFRVRGPGLHVLRITHMRRATPESAEAALAVAAEAAKSEPGAAAPQRPDWDSYWASLVFRSAASASAPKPAKPKR